MNSTEGTISEPSPDSSKPKSPQSTGLDFMRLLAGESSPELDKMILANQVDTTMDRTLKMLQVLWYAKSLGQVKMYNKLMKHYTPAIELLGEGVDGAIQDYQRKHGEL